MNVLVFLIYSVLMFFAGYMFRRDVEKFWLKRRD